MLQAVATAALAPYALMAKLGAFAAQKLADVPAALLALLERKAQELLAGLFGDPLLHQLGGAVQAILRDPKTFIVNLGNALSKGVGGLLTHLSDPKNFIDDVLQWVATQLGIASLPPLPWTWTTLIPVAQEILHLTEDNLTRLLAAALRQHTLLTEGIGGVWAQALAAKQTAAGLAEQVFDGVKQWVLGQLVQGAVSALVKLGVPGAGPFLEAAQGIYAAFQTFLSYKDTLAGLLGQLLPTLSGLAAGTAGAVNATGAAITKVLVGLIQPALDFLARFLGLGGLATRIKTFLHGIQDRINGLIAKLGDRLAGAVKSLAAGHGRGAAPAPGHTPISGHGGTTANHSSTPEKLPEQRFEVEGEAHKIWINAQGTHHSAPVIMMSSTPTPVTDFLSNAQRSTDIPAANKTHIPRARTLVTEMTALAVEVVKLEAEGKDATQKYHTLAARENELCGIIQGILHRIDIHVFDERYKIEGVVGRYDQMPAQTQDMMTGDHQPQAEMLVEVSKLPAFADREIQNVVGNDTQHVPGGIAINLHENRHKAGRTLGGKSRRTLNVGRARLASEVAQAGADPSQQRKAAIHVLKEELDKDVERMVEVANLPNHNEVWRDIHALPLQQVDKDALIDKVRRQILEGEGRIKNQNLERLEEHKK